MQPTILPEISRRRSLPKSRQVFLFRRDGWLCRWCGRPVIFAPTLGYLEKWIKGRGFQGPLAYYHPHWRRDNAPLLDALAAVLDHHTAHSRGGAADENNLVTACNKCNLRKNGALAAEFSKRVPFIPIKSKYGEPTHWDGLSSLFISMFERQPNLATRSQREWFSALNEAQDAPAVSPTNLGL